MPPQVATRLSRCVSYEESRLVYLTVHYDLLWYSWWDGCLLSRSIHPYDDGCHPRSKLCRLNRHYYRRPRQILNEGRHNPDVGIVGSLCEATRRRAGAGPRLYRALYPPRRHL
jgi:hypothetical protein